jgi:predicted dehydrogenase
VLTYPNPLASPQYEALALCNNSVASAKVALKEYDLLMRTKTYGGSKDLANHLEVDLVVYCIGVDRHYKLMKPLLE